VSDSPPTGDPVGEDDIGEDQEVDGLSGERTDLAWSRSGLAVIVCLAAIAKRSLPEISTLDARAIVVVSLIVGGAAWGYALFWARTVAVTSLTGRRIADTHKMLGIALGTVTIGITATIVALLPAR
jgi:uncharacterized membrane protein YidH (DUF202 family)